MTRCILVFFTLFILWASLIHATDVSANFQNQYPSYYGFNTDMRITTDFPASSNGAALSSGDSVCDGAAVTISPSVTSKWAVSKLDVVSMYGCTPKPDCYAKMIGYSNFNGNKDIKWLSQTVYDENFKYGDATAYAADFSDATSQKLYNELSTFYDESIGYVPNPGVPANQSKQGGVNVFCTGQIVVKDGSAVMNSTDMTDLKPMSFTIKSSGTHQITTSLEGVSCFGAVLKHPEDMTDPDKKNFRLYYFVKNPPSFGSSTGLQMTSIEVKPPGAGNCKLSKTEVDVVGTRSTGFSKVHVIVKNDGDPVTMTSVSSSDAGFDASPFDPSLCDALGISASVCPSSNGFNEVIPTGGSKDLNVLLTNKGGSGTILTFTSTIAPSSGSCSGGSSGSSCTFTVDLSSSTGGPTFCEIVPTNLALGTMEVARFGLTCFDLGFNAVPCTGNNWYWADGLSGSFVEKDDTHALAYTTSPAGTSGVLRYRSDTGYADCISYVNSVVPDYACEFIPPKASLNYGQSQFFGLSCTFKGAPQTPDSATYGLHDGLQGIINNDSVKGVTYIAPSFDTSGTLFGFGAFSSALSPKLGAVAQAPITVSSGPAAASCTIEPKSLTYGTREAALFVVTCEDIDHNSVECTGDNWHWAGISGGFVEKDNTHAIAYPTSPPGSAGSLIYTSGSVECSSDISVIAPKYVCAFTPPSANLRYSQSQSFALDCTVDGVPKTPDSATYGLQDGLQGTLSGESVTGVTYTAPDVDSKGKLVGLGGFVSAQSPILGAVDEAPITVSNGTGPTFCAIEPKSLTYGTREAAQFDVACENMDHNSVACAGDNWSFADGLSGGFVEKDNAHAIAYPTSSSGTNGTLRYTSGVAECSSNISVIAPKYICVFTPSSANLKYNQSKSFALGCTVDGVPKTPDSATYGLHDGLQGTLTSESVTGVTYTAPDFDTTGKLVGLGGFVSAQSPILGAVAEAPITVTNGSDIDCPGCSDKGDTKWCQIRGDLSKVFNGFNGLLFLTCGKNGLDACTKAKWTTTSATVDNPFSTTQTIITIKGAKGTIGSISVIVNDDSKQVCSRDFIIGDRACWEIS